MNKHITNEGREFIIRKPEEDDAENIIRYSKVLFASTTQVLTTPDEYTITLEEEKIWIDDFNEDPGYLALVAELDGQIIGLLTFIPQAKRKTAHAGEFGVSVHPDYQKMGIGRALIEDMIKWGKASREIERIVLQVLETNAHAIRLYKGLGFVEEGRLVKAIKQLDGTYVDSIQMYLWLDKSESYKRAEMPSGTSAVLEERTLTASNGNLLDVLKKGQRVLDVGCGSGAITRGIALYVGPEGVVEGIDRSEELIALAKTKYGHMENIGFICGDVLDFNPPYQFDVITTARTIQWIERPIEVIRKMMRLLKPDGILCILDYNHTLIHWDPAPPESMRHFYDRFLQWRSDAGMDNEIGDHMPALLEAEGMKILDFQDRSEYCEKGMPGFETHIGIWNQVAKFRGKQVVADGYLTEAERLKAIAEYSEWMENGAHGMRLHLRATHARF